VVETFYPFWNYFKGTEGLPPTHGFFTKKAKQQESKKTATHPPIDFCRDKSFEKY